MLRNLPGNSLALAALAMLLVLPACSVNVKKGENGEEKKVDIETPVGGIHVGENADPRDTGLPVYPGARVKPKDSSNQSSGNVNISSGLFGLKVVAIEYLSDDPPDKLIAFYRDKLKQYGKNVLECHVEANSDPTDDVDVHIGDKEKKPHELSCNDKHGPEIELKVGTQENQHIVSIKPQDGGKGTAFGLVFVQVHGGDKGKDTI